MLRSKMLKAMFLVVSLTVALGVRAAAPIAWQTSFGNALFAQATREHKFVILDLHATWCHWCHVMEETTYVDDEVRRLIGEHYIAVSVDADNDPDLTARYGNWGWPATIVLAADGTEIVKRRGYMPPAQMISLLQAIVDDPSPGPSVRAAATVGESNGQLSKEARAALLKSYNELYDTQNGGWGQIHKYVDAAAMELAFVQTDDPKLSAQATERARKTLDNNLLLIDPVWGGVYQYSDEVDWRSPHFEKLLSFQANDLRLYAEAYARWRDSRYLKAADALFSYIDQFLTAPDGGFYVSQDADLSHAIDGHQYYKLNDAERRKLGMPRIDKHRYAREAGWAIRALTKYYDVTGNARALQSAERAAVWVIANRSLPEGGFRHSDQDRGGPFLDDNVSMSQAFLSLYRSTGERKWLTHATKTLDFINAHLRDSKSGFIAAPIDAKSQGVFKSPLRLADQNADLVRAANMAYRYSGAQRFREIGLHGMKYLAAYATAEDEQLLPDILLADNELTAAPIHIAIVGGKQDAIARALHAAALQFPADYLQVDWLDRTEGDLPNPDIQYPRLARPAAFACVDGACSSPVYEPEKVAVAVRSALAR